MNKTFTFMRESSTARFFIPVGIILIIFGIIVFFVNTKNQNYVETEATVTKVTIAEEEHIDNEGNKVNTTYNVDIKYTIKEKEYTNTLDNVSKYNVDDKIKIYYDPKDPSKITQTKSIILPIIITAVGCASLIGGIISAANAMKRHKKMKEQERNWENGK